MAPVSVFSVAVIPVNSVFLLISATKFVTFPSAIDDVMDTPPLLPTNEKVHSWGSGGRTKFSSACPVAEPCLLNWLAVLTAFRALSIISKTDFKPKPNFNYELAKVIKKNCKIKVRVGGMIEDINF